MSLMLGYCNRLRYKIPSSQQNKMIEVTLISTQLSGVLSHGIKLLLHLDIFHDTNVQNLTHHSYKCDA